MTNLNRVWNSVYLFQDHNLSLFSVVHLHKSLEDFFMCCNNNYNFTQKYVLPSYFILHMKTRCKLLTIKQLIPYCSTTELLYNYRITVSLHIITTNKNVKFVSTIIEESWFTWRRKSSLNSYTYTLFSLRKRDLWILSMDKHHQLAVLFVTVLWTIRKITY